jgi:O-Antigen ligase
MRRAVPAVAAACLLAGPTVLAFFSGGYFARPRLAGALVAWTLVLALSLISPPVPRSAPGRLALGGLVALTAWTAISIAWAPLHGPATENVERLVLYVGVLLLAIGVLREPRALRSTEPALAAGATVVISYGLSGRLLPGVIHLSRSASAGGRLEQPLTYWNAEGALAAVGLVLCARLAGDPTRPRLVRGLAAAAAAPLGAGVYLSYSRGAIACGLVGLAVLVATAPTRAQLRAAALALATAVAAAAAAAAFPGVASLQGAHPERDGALVLALLAAVALAAAFAATRPTADAPLRGARRLGRLVAVAAVLVAAALVVEGLSERPSPQDLAAHANAARLTSVTSNRYEYWRIGLKAFERHPIAGLGAAGFRVFWLRERPIREAVRDVHSLEFELAAELGLVGLLAFGAAVAGTALSARRALRARPALAAGACAASVTWLLHASIDWDWEMPAATLPALILVGALIAISDAAR